MRGCADELHMQKLDENTITPLELPSRQRCE
jgi:hypothetical protein